MIELVLRIGLSLAVVVGLMWALARLVNRPLSRRTGTALTVLGRQQFTRGSSVAIIRVADRALVLGITEQQVRLLADVDADAVDRPPEPGAGLAVPDAGDPPAGPLAGSALSPRTWRQAVESLRARTARR